MIYQHIMQNITVTKIIINFLQSKNFMELIDSQKGIDLLQKYNIHRMASTNIILLIIIMKEEQLIMEISDNIIK